MTACIRDRGGLLRKCNLARNMETMGLARKLYSSPSGTSCVWFIFPFCLFLQSFEVPGIFEPQTSVQNTRESVLKNRVFHSEHLRSSLSELSRKEDDCCWGFGSWTLGSVWLRWSFVGSEIWCFFLSKDDQSSENCKGDFQV